MIISPDTADYIVPGFGRYSFGAIANVIVYRYSYGFPTHRLETIFKYFDLPISDSTLWDHIEQAWQIVKYFEKYLWQVACNAKLIKIDDGTARVIELRKQIEGEIEKCQMTGLSTKTIRTGIHTTCIYAETEHGDLRLFSTGIHHSGEVFWEMMSSRIKDDKTIMRMSDCGSMNSETPPELIPNPEDTSFTPLNGPAQSATSAILYLYCLQHVRDRFVKLKDHFPQESQKVLDWLAKVYAIDAKSKALSLSEQARLAFHQEYSAPIMEELKNWCENQMSARNIEPNSNLGEAVIYLLAHYHDVTGFLRHGGASLDNNLSEQTVKVVKRHLKNSQSYLTNQGSKVGDCFMTVIETVKLYDISPIKFIEGCLFHGDLLLENPEKFAPWNFKSTMAALTAKQSFKSRYGPPTVNITVPPKFKTEDLGPSY